MAKLDPYFSLFNAHINNAGERAMAVLEGNFPSWAAEVRTYGDGMIRIFDEEPTKATAAYIALVTAFVNENEKDE